ncbi:MAG: 1-deoxy-D-xylulose-5-phosphate synthase N-terminal domain-containing protein [Thermaurantimonas sp.]
MEELIFRGKAIRSPEDIRSLPVSDLPELCRLIREYVSRIPTDKQAHLESSVCVTELSVALHYVLNTPLDKLIWDVGHQTAVHKVLTGRGPSMFQSLRKLNGISGFPSPAESPFDLFTTGHSSTSISLAIGLWLAGEKNKIAAVIGDGALTGGQAFEAINLAGDMNASILLILNDNGLSIDENVGALSKTNRYDSFFTSLNFKYLGEIDGNDIQVLIPALRDAVSGTGPRVLRICTRLSRFHTLSHTRTSYTPIRSAVNKCIRQCLNQDKDFYVLSPAMLSGIGLSALKADFQDRIIDTGITEQACVSIAAGLAKSGKKVLVHIYSTFLQRAVDQIIHDVALQRLPVFFLVDRAGLVGEDGPTHHGVFDFTVLSTLPDIEIHFPYSIDAIQNTILHWYADPRLMALRIPRDSNAFQADRPLPAEIWREARTTMVAVGMMAHQAYQAFTMLTQDGYDLNFATCTVYPFSLQDALVEKLLTQKTVFFVEEAYAPGSVSEKLIFNLMTYPNSKILSECQCIHLPHEFIPHGSPSDLLHLTALRAEDIYNNLKTKLNSI